MSGKFNKRAIVVIVAIIAAVAVVGGSLAWFVTQSSLSQKFGISGFTAGAQVYFLDGEKKVDAKAYVDGDGLYVLSLDKSAENYIGKLRADVTLSGARACVRVRMSHEWKNAEGKIAQYTAAIPYVFAENWFDNRSADYCVYYQAKDLSGKSDFEKTPFIVGFDDSSLDSFGLESGASVRVLIQVDAVQVNRYPQLWNIDALPWK